jgi:FAD/FMN-containing dehydrogenase
MTKQHEDQLPTPVSSRASSSFARNGVAAGLRGALILPGDQQFDAARRGYNLIHDRRPALVFRPKDADDVARALILARQAGLEVAVRGGGHSLAGYSSIDGGLQLDLSAMHSVEVDPATKIGWAGGGATAGAMTSATIAQGLVVPFGDDASVGVGGITVGGGVGWLSRKYGLSLDSLLGVEIVTADGRTITANDTEHPDLFWAIRGGGGNFGVVTRFRFRLQPMGPVLGGALILPASRDVIRGVLALAAAAPDDLGTIALVMRLPPLSIVPTAAHGKLAVLMTVVWSGQLDQGAPIVEAFRKLGPPIADLVRPMPYTDMYNVLAGAPAAITNVTHSFLSDEVDDPAIDAMLDHLEPTRLPSTRALAVIEIRALGGAIARVQSDATAFAGRQRKFICSVVTAGFEPTDLERHRAWVGSLSGTMSHLAKGAYLNFIDCADESRLHEVYPGPTYQRLAEVKRRYDPTNLFRHNLNVKPSKGEKP